LIPTAHSLVTDKQQRKGPSFRRKKVLAWLQNNVPDKRLKHILRVEEMAIALANHHHLDAEKAAQAGLMHDLAKFFKPKRLLEMARSEGMDLDSVYEANPHLLHADVGAIVARDEFDMEDSEVLEAIRNHTLGSPGMSPLSCVVYLADGLEPGRGDTPELNLLRQTSHENLHQAVWLTSEFTMRSLLSSNRLIHPRAVLTRNWAMQMTHPTHESSL
jgi:predicted HD superfamily hydrolase involved in NAD metabolism